MPAYPVKSSPKILWRGHHIPQNNGDVLKTYKTRTCEGEDVGKVVYATSHLWHAAAYGLKYQPSSIGLQTVNGKSYPFVFMSFPNEKFVSFEEVQKYCTYLQRVSGKNFKRGVFDKKPTGNEIPIEWISHNDVKVEKVWKIPNNKLLLNGVQVFTTTGKVFDEYITCPGFWHLSNLINAELVTWENYKLYKQAPSACPDALFELFGKEVQERKMRTRHSSSTALLQPSI